MVSETDSELLATVLEDSKTRIVWPAVTLRLIGQLFEPVPQWLVAYTCPSASLEALITITVKNASVLRFFMAPIEDSCSMS